MTNLPEDQEARELVDSPVDDVASPADEVASHASAQKAPDATLVSSAAPIGQPDAPPNSLPIATDSSFPDAEPLLFQSFAQAPARPPARIPNFGHLAMLIPIGGVAFAGTIAVLLAPMHFHWFGWSMDTQAAASNVQLILASEAILYLITFAISLAVFPHFWNKGFFAGLQWRGAVALERFWPLAATALACAGLAVLDEVLMPGPSNAPIEKMMSAPGAAWLMFAFGTTIAPFFEEMFFRGFLLPALCTAFDWIAERNSDGPPLESASGRPRWTLDGTIIASLVLFGPAVLALLAILFGGRVPFVIAFACVLFVVWAVVRVVRTAGTHSRTLAPLVDTNGAPQWSLAAMAVASVLTSIPFALLHVDQQGHALGPFLLLILVSLILCTVRLKTRSLAASTLVHACYNFILFSLALIGTGGFRHFDKM
jgi:uncharacterized protein